MASAHDTKTYCRQTLIGESYDLLNTTTFVPNPNYYSKNLCIRVHGNGDQQLVNIISTERPSLDANNEGVMPSHKRWCNLKSIICYVSFIWAYTISAIDFEPCSKLEDLNLDRKNSNDIEERYNSLCFYIWFPYNK